MSRWVLWTGAALVAMLCRAQNVTQADLDSLRNLLSGGVRQQALEKAEQLLERAGTQLPALLALGQLLGVQKEFTLAERAFTRASEVAPDSFEAQFNLGFTRFQVQNLRAAVRPLEKAAALRPESFEPNYLLGVTLSETGRKLDAIRRLRMARRLKPQHAGLLALLGVLYGEAGYPLDAMETLDEARRLDPSRLSVWLTMIQAAHDAYEFETTLSLATEAASQFPDSADAHFRLGFELETAGRFDEARAALERALELKPEHLEAHLALGRTQLRAGLRSAAVEHFEAVLRVQPKNGMARLELAKAFVGNREFARAKPILLALVEESGDPTPHLLLSQVYSAEGNTADSARHRARYLELTSLQKAGGMSGSLTSRKLRRYVP